ncbi:hypothetical protein EDD21DRAFT_40731 [Dissophora ornata]|nr:hypothetical protein EDD21DRAFT_40731 [Dissophora ornata]
MRLDLPGHGLLSPQFACTRTWARTRHSMQLYCSALMRQQQLDHRHCAAPTRPLLHLAALLPALQLLHAALLTLLHMAPVYASTYMYSPLPEKESLIASPIGQSLLTNSQIVTHFLSFPNPALIFSAHSSVLPTPVSYPLSLSRTHSHTLPLSSPHCHS